jgi:hypothetical protein
MRSPWLTCGMAAAVMAAATFSSSPPAQAMPLLSLGVAVQESNLKQDVQCGCGGCGCGGYAYYSPYAAYGYYQPYAYSYYPSYSYGAYAYAPYAYGAYAYGGYGPRVWVGRGRRGWW